MLLVSRWLNKFYCSSHVRQLLMPDGGKWEMNIQKLTVVLPVVRLLQTERKIRYWRKYGVVWKFSHFCPADGCIYSFRTKLSKELWRSDFSEIQSEFGVCVRRFARVTHSIHESIYVRRWIDQLLHASTSNYFSIDVNKYALHFCSNWKIDQMLSECECAVPHGRSPLIVSVQFNILTDTMAYHPHNVYLFDERYSLSLISVFSNVKQMGNEEKEIHFSGRKGGIGDNDNFLDYMLICLFSNGIDLGVKCIRRCLFSYWKMHWTKNENIFSLSIVRNGNGVVCFRNGNPVLFGHPIDLSQCQSLSSTNVFWC